MRPLRIDVGEGAFAGNSLKDALLQAYQQAVAHKGHRVNCITVYPHQMDFSVPFSMRSHVDDFRHYVNALAVVMPSPLHRAILKAHASAFPRPFPFAIAETTSEAEAWLAQQRAPLERA